MKHEFTYVYELDCTVGEAVAAYLDAEHYVYLHRQYSAKYEVLEHWENKIRILSTWQLGRLKFGNSCVCEYVPPARFLNYDVRPWPRYVPSIHHVMATRTDLRYYPADRGDRTVSHLTVELDIAPPLWPFRKLIEKKLRQLKWEKDQEDIEMVQRRREIYGPDNLASYIRESQFMLHKDLFVEHFGPSAPRLDVAALRL